MKSIENCRGCGRSRLEPRLSMNPMPLAGQFCTTRQEALAVRRSPLTWMQCWHCDLVQVLEDVDDGELYSKYNYASSTVPGLVRHFAEYAQFLKSTYPEPIGLLEIGCNDGVLLNQLPDEWFLVGVDPSDVARAVGPMKYTLVNEPFSSKFATPPHYDVVTGSNCLAHISDLRDVFEGVAKVLRPEGDLFVEVHDLDVTLRTGQWDTIYHEHKAEWSRNALKFCLRDLGLFETRSSRLPLHGGLLRAGFALGERPPTPWDNPVPFNLLIEKYRDRHTSPAVLAAQKTERVAAYGASGRANVWLNQLPEVDLMYVVDESPLRSGKFVPGRGIPIVTPDVFREDPPDLCIVTAWNYAADIKAKHAWFKGAWVNSMDCS